MKKILIALIFMLLFGINNSFSAWYGNHSVSAPNPGNTTLRSVHGGGPNKGTWCDDDIDGIDDSGKNKVALNNNSTTKTPHGSSKLEITGTTIRCLYWDGEKPIVTDDYSYDGTWKKLNSVTITLSPSDTGGSNLETTKWCEGSSCNPLSGIEGTTIVKNADYNNIIRYQSWDKAGNASDIGTIDIKLDNTPAGEPTISSSTHINGKWSNDNEPKFTITNGSGGPSPVKSYYCLDNNNTCNPSIEGNNKDYTSLTDGIHYFRAKSCDTGGCSSIVNWVLKIDTTQPSASDVGAISPAENSYFIATDSKNVSVTVGVNGGSPITKIEYANEDYNTNNSYISPHLIENDGTINRNFNFQNVDKSRNGRGYREYSFKIYEICDEAGNCNNSVNKVFKHNVYANNIDSGKSSITGIDNLKNGTKIADGTNNLVKLILKDKYNNKIVPVKKSNNSVIRNVDVNINYNNNLYLDSYKQRNSAVQIGTSILNTGNNKNTPNIGIFHNQANGIYNFNFKVYSPTDNSYNKTKGSFKINNIKASVSDITGDKTFSSDVVFKFKPIYKTTFGGDLKNYGFNEGTTQSSDISIRSESTSQHIGEKKLYLEFGKSTGASNDGSSNKINNDFSLKNYSTNIDPEGNQGNYYNLTSTGFVDQNLKTLLVEDNANVSNFSGAYLASFVKYKVDGKTIVYPSDIIGKSSYFGGVSNNSNIFKGIKVLGKTFSEKNNIIANQDGDINNINGFLDKSLFKKTIRKNAYELIKNINPTTNCGIPSVDCKYKKLGNVIYYKLNGGKIKYSKVQSSYKSTGKTILIEGGDLVIDGDINVSGIMGIVVLKNENGKGGNILVDDDVLNINAIMYSDKILAPYDIGKNRILTLDDGQGYFRNQLYIKGSLFSNNTIGGARKNSLGKYRCPYYITATCDMKEAQKYDLNYVRRYFRYDSDGDGNLDTVANGGNHSSGVTGDNLNYPLIIKYNPLIQTTPPPLFTK